MVILEIHKAPSNRHILICKLQCYQCTSRTTCIESMNVCVIFFYFSIISSYHKETPNGSQCQWRSPLQTDTLNAETPAAWKTSRCRAAVVPRCLSFACMWTRFKPSPNSRWCNTLSKRPRHLHRIYPRTTSNGGVVYLFTWWSVMAEQICRIFKVIRGAIPRSKIIVAYPRC